MSACAAFIKESRMESRQRQQDLQEIRGKLNNRFTELLAKLIGSFDGTGEKRHPEEEIGTSPKGRFILAQDASPGIVQNHDPVP